MAKCQIPISKDYCTILTPGMCNCLGWWKLSLVWGLSWSVLEMSKISGILRILSFTRNISFLSVIYSTSIVAAFSNYSVTFHANVLLGLLSLKHLHYRLVNFTSMHLTSKNNDPNLRSWFSFSLGNDNKREFWISCFLTLSL